MLQGTGQINSLTEPTWLAWPDSRAASSLFLLSKLFPPPFLSSLQPYVFVGVCVRLENKIGLVLTPPLNGRDSCDRFAETNMRALLTLPLDAVAVGQIRTN